MNGSKGDNLSTVRSDPSPLSRNLTNLEQELGHAALVINFDTEDTTRAPRKPLRLIISICKFDPPIKVALCASSMTTLNVKENRVQIGVIARKADEHACVGSGDGKELLSNSLGVLTDNHTE